MKGFNSVENKMNVVAAKIAQIVAVVLIGLTPFGGDLKRLKLKGSN
jgi:hypothetical protein